MNGPFRMYRLKPVVRHDVPVTLPDCMYKLKNIHCSRNGVVARQPDQVPSKNLDISDQNNQNENEMAQLEVRQDQILKQLAELKQKMAGIRKDLNHPVQGLSSSIGTVYVDHQVKLQYDGEIIINASPTHPPLSLELLQRLWQKSVHLVVKNHMHSSLTIFDTAASDLWDKLETFTPATNVPQVRVRLIWKKLGADLELLVGSTKVLGEINLLRFLAMSCSGPLNYDELPNANEIDNVLDKCYCLSKATTQSERLNILKLISKPLEEKSKWIGNTSDISVADLAAYSAIKQIFLPNEYSTNVASWLKRCSIC